jgi:hypothetical protein
MQEFHAFAAVKKLLNFGANMTPKIILQISTPPKGTSLRKSASIEALWSIAVAVLNMRSSGNCIFHVYRGADPTEPIVIIVCTSCDLTDVVNWAKFHIDRSRGRVWWGSKDRMFP